MGAENKWRPCEADVHVAGCSGVGSTKDHFTPKCIATQVLRWRSGQINDGENLQFLSPECHREKDRTTAERLTALLEQERGGEITWDDVRRWSARSEYNKPAA